MRKTGRLLIVLNGIETPHDIFHLRFHFLLIVLNGIETTDVMETVLTGIAFNRTKWN